MNTQRGKGDYCLTIGMQICFKSCVDWQDV